MKILILDNERFNVDALKDRLEFEGFEVQVVEKPELCLELARRARFDLIILDIDLGSYASKDFPDGLAVASRLRKESATAKVPIVGITGKRPDLQEAALQIGLVKFFRKPLRPNVFVPAIRSLLESSTKAQKAMASWLAQVEGEHWNVVELIVSNDSAKMRSRLVVEQAPAALEGHDLKLSLRQLYAGQMDKALFEELGRRLHRRLFPGEVNAGLQQCRLLSRLTQQPVRLLLRLEDALWDHLPWELCLYRSGAHGGHWLGGDPFLTCSRMAVNSGPLKPDAVLEMPLKILVVAASPVASPELDFAGELHDLVEALHPVARGGGKPGVQWQVLGPQDLAGIAPGLEWFGEASPAKVREALFQFRPHLVHVMAHGSEGRVHLEGSGLHSEWLDFFLQFDLVARDVRLLVLNCCFSGHPGESTVGVALAGLTAGVTAVVGHLYRVSDHAARHFARLLYQDLAAGMPLDSAVQSARSRVWSEELQENRPFLPLLFVRDQFLRFDLGTAGH